MRALSIALMSLALALPVQAETDPVDQLYDALQLNDVIDIMREEGIGYGAELEEDLFPGRGGVAWTMALEAIYQRDEMETQVRAEFAERLKGVEIDPLVDFFTSDRGSEIISLEIEARRAMMDQAVEDMAESNMAEMTAKADPRMAQIDEFVEANDLVESNVAGAMNSNYAFYQGLVAGGAFGDDFDDSRILSDVWSQEPEIRTETHDWVYSFLALAYHPLSDDDLDVYTALSQTDEGRALNAALFGAFDEMYVDLSRNLGAQAAAFMAGQDL